MGLTRWTAAEIPDYADPNDLAAVMKEYTDDVDHHHVLFCTSVVERDTLYAAAPKSTLVSSADLGALYQKTSDTLNTWRTLLIDTGWITAGFTYPNADWAAAAGTGTVKIRNKNGTVNLRASITYTGPDVAVASNGNIVADPILLQIPAEYIPPENLSAHGIVGGVGCSIVIDTLGRVRIVAGSTGFTLTSGHGLFVDKSWVKEG